MRSNFELIILPLRKITASEELVAGDYMATIGGGPPDLGTYINITINTHLRYESRTNEYLAYRATRAGDVLRFLA